MSSSFNHIFIPAVILLLFSRSDSRKVMALSFFAVLPDMDAIFLPHRAVFHNAFILVIPLLLFISVKSMRENSGIIFFYLASHLLLDIFNGGVFLLYPVYDNVLFAHAELLFNRGSFSPKLDYGISGDIMNMGRGEPVISSENIGTAILLMVFAAIAILHKNRKKT